MFYRTFLAILVSFLASFCIMVIELVAGRILAPHVGQHLYSWTSIIGICLAGISVGAWIGGMLADAFPSRATLGWLLFIAGVLTIAIPFLTDAFGSGNVLGLHGNMSLMNRILIITSVIFLPAQIVLGMVSPVVIRLTISKVENAGSIVGRIYAFSTLGSIIGTFTAGFYLIEAFGVRTILYGVGAALIMMAPIFGGVISGLFSRALATGMLFASFLDLAVCSILLLIGMLIFPNLYQHHAEVAKPLSGINVSLAPFSAKFEERYNSSSLLFFKETDYYTIRVMEATETDIEDSTKSVVLSELILDNLIHSHSIPNDPKYLQYEYLHIYRELVDWKLKKKGSTAHRELFVGGGGYTLPRYFLETYNDSHIDVVEIDRWVSEIAYKFMGVPRNDPRLVTENRDGRLFVKDKQDLPAEQKYNFVFGDAFNDLSIPYHLTTKEFNDQIKNLMTDDGLFMALVIDHIGEGLFLPSYLNTIRQTFGNDNVCLILVRGEGTAADMDELEHQTVIVVASKDKLELESFKAYLKERTTNNNAIFSIPVPPSELSTYLANPTRKPVILTDDYAPVDNLTAPMFEKRFGYKKDTVKKTRKSGS